MKTKFPNLQGFIIKPVKPAKETGKEDDKKKKNLNVSTAFVFNGHVIATDGKIVFFYNLKEYLKHYMQSEDGEDPTNGVALISKIVEALEGKTLSKDFFNVFSKMQTITKIDEFKIYVENGSLHSEYSIEDSYDADLLISFLKKQKTAWTLQRSAQGQFGIGGAIYTSIASVLKPEMQNDALVFDRTADDKVRFCFVNKDFVFGICQFSIESESSITKFTEADDFFDLHV